MAAEITHLQHPHLHRHNRGRDCHQFGTDPAEHTHATKHSGLVKRIMHHHKIVSTNVAVAGVTGKLGRLITKHLLENEDVQVHGIARNPDKLPDALRSHPRLKLFKSDMKDVNELRGAVKDCSILISVVLSDPAEEISMQKAMIDACVAEKVPRFMPNEFTLDWRAIDLNLLPQKKVNQEIFTYLSKQEGKVKGVHILIGGFMETLFSAGFFYDPRKSPAEGLSTWGDGNNVWEFTSYNNAAQWAATLALENDATGFYRFLGDRLTINEIAQTLQETYNLPPIKFTSKGTLEDLKGHVEQGAKRSPNPDRNNFWDWLGQAYTLFLSNGQAYLEAPLQNSLYVSSVQQETLEDWLSDKKLEDLSRTAWTL